MQITIEVNLNDNVKVKLTEAAKQLHRKDHEERWAPYGLEYHAPKEDEEGYSKWQLWNLMQFFGPLISLGSASPFEGNIIKVSSRG